MEFMSVYECGINSKYAPGDLVYVYQNESWHPDARWPRVTWKIAGVVRHTVPAVYDRPERHRWHYRCEIEVPHGTVSNVFDESALTPANEAVEAGTV